MYNYNKGKSISDLVKVVKKQSVVFISKVQKLIREFAKKEIALFPTQKYALSFKPFYACQGLAILALLAIAGFFFIPRVTVDQSLVIKSAQDLRDPILVGEIVKHTVILKKSNISASQPYLKIAKSANKIKVTNISKQQAESVKIEKAKQGTVVKTTQEQRLALVAEDPPTTRRGPT